MALLMLSDELMINSDDISSVERANGKITLFMQRCTNLVNNSINTVRSRQITLTEQEYRALVMWSGVTDLQRR